MQVLIREPRRVLLRRTRRYVRRSARELSLRELGHQNSPLPETMEAVAEQPAAEAASAAEPPTPEAPPSPPPPVEPPTAPAAPASGGGGFTLPTVTRARQLAETPELQDVVSKLLGLCAQEPATSICAVAEALARQQPGRCVQQHTLTSLQLC